MAKIALVRYVNGVRKRSAKILMPAMPERKVPMEIVKRSLEAVKEAESEKVSKKTTSHLLRDAMENVTPKEYLTVYSDYYEAGLAWCLDAMQKVTSLELTESEIRKGLQKYAETHTIEKEGQKRIDLPLWISASAIVSALSHDRPLANAWYGVAWSFYHATNEQGSEIVRCMKELHKEKAKVNLIKKAKV